MAHSRPGRAVVAAGLTAALAALGATALALAPTAHAAAADLTAAFTKTSSWSSGYGGDYIITNRGDATSSSWILEFDLPSGTTITKSWSATHIQNGQHHRFTNLSYNGDIAPGASEDFGFNASGTGLPLNCTINGKPCDTVAPTTPPPSTPAPTTPPTTAPPTTTPPAGAIVDVATAAQLQAALSTARPGQTIRLAAGTYRGAFLTQRAGTASARITLTGPRTAVLINDGPAGTAPSCPAPTAGWDPGYGLWLYDAPYWNLTGFTVTQSKKGIVLDNSHHVTIDGMHVHHIDEEAVHFRRSSADGIIRDSVITDTGLVQQGYGEAVYIGSAKSNFGCHGNSGGMDRSDRVQVLNNQIGPNVTAEHVDVKEGTEGGVIRGNRFNGQGISGANSADSWVDVKGNDYLIEDNTGTFRAPGTFANGYETHNLLDGYGCGNTWRDNTSDLGGVGRYAIRITSTSKCSSSPNVVHSSNTVTGAVDGLTNIPTTP
ncbi:cellulose binding domain-containing protein [Micromonospora marina]|uniref:cellulose binding domain-containing protein n=1 Tax=Micromonospora marina TaxID=307120 RepID=UPI003D7195C4